MNSDDQKTAAAKAHRFAVRCNIGPGLRGYSFDSWRADLVPIPPAVKRWLDSAGTSNLVLWGKPAIGKTHLALACLRQLWDSGNESLWFHDAARVDRDLSAAVGAGSARVLSGLTESQVLLLDGLERDRLDSPCLALLEQIFEHRARSGRSLLITTREDPNSGPLQETGLGRVLRAAQQVAGDAKMPSGA